MEDKVSSRAGSAFDRLKVQLTPKEGNQKPKKTESKEKSEDSIVRVASEPLRASASNNFQAAATLNSLSDAQKDREEVAKANEASSRSTVRDVEEAAALAEKLAFRIANKEDEAMNAIKSPNANVVRDLLS